MYKELYGICSSENIRHSKFYDDLYNMGLKPCKSELNILTRRHEYLWENISVYVDDLDAIVHDPCTRVAILQENIATN